MPVDRPAGRPARHEAGLFLGGVLFVYWTAAAGLLVAVAVASLVVAGERASAIGRLTGQFRLAAVPVAVAVELAVALLAGLSGKPGLGALAGGLFLLALWLAGAPSAGRAGPQPGVVPSGGAGD
jgi:hypothetical protein